MEGRRLGVKLLALAFAFLVVLVVLPLPPHQAGPGLDASWAQGLHIAIERGFAFGTQLVFTYGPLGFVHARMYWPGLFAVTLAFWLALALGIVDGWRGTARGHGALVVAAAVILLAALGFASAYAFDTIVFVYLLLWVWQAESSQAHGRGRLAAHGAAIGIIALSKLTFGAAGATALAAVAVILAARGQWRLAWIPVATSALAFLLGWVALGQSLATLPAYVLNGMQIVTGYPEAMALRGPLWELRAFGWAVVLLLGLAIAAAWRQRGVSTWSALGFTLLMVALAWKQGFTRHDGHVAAGFAFAIALGGVLAARFSATAPRRAAAMIAVAAGVVGAFLLSVERRDHTARMATEIVARRPLDALRSLGSAHLWQSHREAGYAAMRADQPIPPLPGSVDVYSYDQAPAFAHGLPWNPRPVIQSYSAYTAPLAAMNRRHLEGPSAPDHVLVRVQAIDGRFPALEDGASWLTLMERYQVREESSFLILDRAREVRPATRHALPPWRGRGWLSLPADAPLVLAALDVDLPRRSLRATFRGPPMLDLEVRVAGESAARRYRLVRDAAREPFVLSPLIETQYELADLFLPCPGMSPGVRIEAIRVLDSGGREVEYGARLETAEVPRFPQAPAADARAARCHLEPVDGKGPAGPATMGDGYGRGLNVHPPSRWKLRQPVRSIEICTRLAAPPRDAKGASDGYVLSLVQAGAKEPIASTRVDGREKRRGEACVSAKFPAPTLDVEVQLDPGGNTEWDWVYVSRLKLDE
jgi:hypothetical protein